MVERHEAPVVSFHTYVEAGSVDDSTGTTGLAHMFEHMAFKGTETIGTTDWPAEKKALEAVEQASTTPGCGTRQRAHGQSRRRLQARKGGADGGQTAQDPTCSRTSYTRIIEENGGTV